MQAVLHNSLKSGSPTIRKAKIFRLENLNILMRHFRRLMAGYNQVLNTPLIAECRTRQTCGIFSPIGFLWPSVSRNKRPARGILLAVYERCSNASVATLNKWRALNNLIGTTMSHGTHPGAIRPKPAQEILQGILCELEAAADLVEQLLTHGRDQEIFDAVARSITAMADMLTAGLDDRNDAMAAQWEREQQARQADAIAEIHAAIEASPTLRHLRSEAGCPVTWAKAVEIDRHLQEDRQWAGKPVSERFSEVVNRLADLGLVAVESEASAHG